MKEREDVKIGLEIHVQLSTKSKLFCPCSAHWLDEPNKHICPICTSQPGSKPAGINKKAIIQALKVAYLLNAKIQDGFLFQRKHYFYPDLPSNYQRTSTPIAVDGNLLDVGIVEMHIEEDPGRYHLKEGLVDYNRSGIPLIEIVTSPSIHSPEQANEFLTTLKRWLVYADVMKGGQECVVRADVNVSIGGGARVEIKNVNSFSNVVEAIKSEVKRQESILAQGLNVEQETRHFDEGSGTTFRLRRKETADDYRYVPDPDLLPISLCQEWLEEAKKELGEHPGHRLQRLIQQYNLDENDAERIMAEKELADVFEEMAKELDAKKSASFLTTFVKKQLNYRNLLFRQSGLSSKGLTKLLSLFLENKISDDGMERVLIKMIEEKRNDVEMLVKELDVLVITNEEFISKMIEEVFEKERHACEDFRKGNKKALFYLIGKVMELTKGKVDPKKVGDMIKAKLGGANG